MQVQMLMLGHAQAGQDCHGRLQDQGRCKQAQHAVMEGSLQKIEQQLRQEVRQRMVPAESEHSKQAPEGMDVPQEMACRRINSRPARLKWNQY